ncbi:DUF362 domain-containing protein, partial [Oscillospiraceae bacterium OttesenSCG-928-F05]|nr:DUF362 domain-containing protein [Oscillospiraceae bacterium OttesenSCG-928-F05]
MDKRVCLCRCQSYENDEVRAAVRRILDAFGGAKAMIKPGDKVLIKPNLIIGRAPEEATTTHPSVVAAVAAEFAEAGGKVTIADSPGGAYTEENMRKIYKLSGLEAAAEATGALLNYDMSARTVALSDAKVLSEAPVISPVLDADFIISLAKLKTHSLAYYTGAVKNLFGVIPGIAKKTYHARFISATQFCEMLTDLCEFVKPGFSIVDGVVGMEGPGPTGGTPKRADVIGGAVNPYALDMAMGDVAGLQRRLNVILNVVEKRGLCPSTAAELE